MNKQIHCTKNRCVEKGHVECFMSDENGGYFILETVIGPYDKNVKEYCIIATSMFDF